MDLNVLRNLINSVLKLSDDYRQRDRRSRNSLLGNSEAMCVITSYSIHYTKLYDASMKVRHWHAAAA